MIAGFVRFDDMNFPTDAWKANKGAGKPRLFDNTLYAVARCGPTYHNFDSKFITKVTIDEKIYLIPVRDLLGPACVVPNVFTKDRMRQDKESWLFVMPRRKWGRMFGDTIKWS